MKIGPGMLERGGEEEGRGRGRVGHLKPRRLIDQPREERRLSEKSIDRCFVDLSSFSRRWMTRWLKQEDKETDKGKCFSFPLFVIFFFLSASTLDPLGAPIFTRYYYGNWIHHEVTNFYCHVILLRTLLLDFVSRGLVLLGTTWHYLAVVVRVYPGYY